MLKKMFGKFATLFLGKASKPVAGVAGAAVIAMATQFIMPWEGKRNHAYLDTIASPAVWTVCYGQTGPKAYKGAYYTDAECLDMLQESVGKYYAEMDKCLTNKSTPVSVQASMLELGYNVGTGALCKSTMMRLANAGEYKAACGELDKWVKAGGKTINGLVNRRNASKEMCMQDVK